ncbi:LIC11966 family surface protein [Sphingobacterium hungaricum]|uniref:Lipoprotein n=1 Tax=Sphingobacterium hungaricum TaxID=2082723 RepID=A0A928UW10_9SPHI|nr:hypothetical protein [Sphingobacterium hungaricum]MBE8712164.1 hypothetical protein [Sphingobacterium hungaricum]
MKNLIASGLSLIAMLLIVGCGSNEKRTPQEYNNELMTIINGNEQEISKMNAAMTASNYDQATIVQKEWSAAVDRDIKKVDSIGAYKDDKQLQEAVWDGLKGYKKIVNEDYPKLIEIRKSNLTDPTGEQQALENINAAFENMANKVNVASDAFEAKHVK